MTKYIYQDNLESLRLVTRKLIENDIVIWSDFFAEKDAVELFPTFGLITNSDRAKQWIEKQLARYSDNRFGLQALIDKTSKKFIGQCGLVTQEVDGKTEIEVGYHILKQYWGQGYAPEAAKLFIDYAFKNNLTQSVISIIDKRNFKSQRVAEKNGLEIEKETKWSDIDVYIYRIEKNNWK